MHDIFDTDGWQDQILDDHFDYESRQICWFVCFIVCLTVQWPKENIAGESRIS